LKVNQPVIVKMTVIKLCVIRLFLVLDSVTCLSVSTVPQDCTVCFIQINGEEFKKGCHPFHVTIILWVGIFEEIILNTLHEGGFATFE